MGIELMVMYRATLRLHFLPDRCPPPSVTAGSTVWRIVLADNRLLPFIFIFPSLNITPYQNLVSPHFCSLFVISRYSFIWFIFFDKWIKKCGFEIFLEVNNVKFSPLELN